MIVRSAGSSIELITQPDHAQLARRVMERCPTLQAHPRRDSILHAIGEHDNGWAEEDAAPQVDPSAGDVVDFIHAPVAVRQRVWPRAVSRLSADPWAAALVAQHALTAYDRFRPDPEWTSFFDEMTAMRDERITRAEAELKDLLGDYLFVRVGDLISLTFCLGRAGEQQFADYTIALAAGGVRVHPDLFGGASVPVEVQARVLPARTFVDDEDLRDALKTAGWIRVRGEVGDRAAE